MVFEPFLTEIRHNCASRSGLEYAFCTIKSRGTEIIVLGCKLHSGSPARLSFVLKIPLYNLLPRVINFVPCDWIVQRAYWVCLANKELEIF